MGAKDVNYMADGYSTVHNRMSHGEIQNYLYELIGGTHRQLFYIYCQAYRFLIVLGVVLFCLNGSRKKKGDVLYYIMFLSLAGGIAFYMLWEAKNIYSAAFLLPMIILAQEALELYQRIYSQCHRYMKDGGLSIVCMF